MRNFAHTTLGLAALLIATAGCKSMQSGVYQEGLIAENGEPAYITVQHCLIGFAGALPGVSRSQAEAEELALELFEKAKQGDDFGQMVTRYTDDSPPGIYRMANHGYDGDMSSRIASRNVYKRTEMVPAFGDTGFPLDVGEFGLAPYDPEKSPYGWHIVKRVN